MNTIILGIILMIAVLYRYFGTVRDFRLWKNPKTRKQVLETFPRNMSDRTIFNKFLKVNGREVIILLSGIAVGILIAVFT